MIVVHGCQRSSCWVWIFQIYVAHSCSIYDTNLPYCIDDGFKVTYSEAILEYIAGEYGMSEFGLLFVK
ncbi:unnamed protein product [Taenia asiatica]|uniref:GST N-terminal domain-containing protein n=1 Tax=Taenia asiatica TaxID=60517 RepID=A0A0R3WAK9_TAEAS|nr:unnamed protein product [Taenia asiatica]